MQCSKPEASRERQGKKNARRKPTDWGGLERLAGKNLHEAAGHAPHSRPVA